MPQIVTGLVMQAAQAFDAIDLIRQQTQHGGLIAAAGPDLQHAPQATGNTMAQEFRHAGHHTGFGDGLTQANGQTRVLVRLIDQGAIHKPVPLNGPHGRQDQRVGNTLSRQLVRHVLTQCTGVQPAPQRRYSARRLDALAQCDVRWCGLLTLGFASRKIQPGGKRRTLLHACLMSGLSAQADARSDEQRPPAGRQSGPNNPAGHGRLNPPSTG